MLLRVNQCCPLVVISYNLWCTGVVIIPKSGIALTPKSGVALTRITRNFRIPQKFLFANMAFIIPKISAITPMSCE